MMVIEILREGRANSKTVLVLHYESLLQLVMLMSKDLVLLK